MAVCVKFKFGVAFTFITAGSSASSSSPQKQYFSRKSYFLSEESFIFVS